MGQCAEHRREVVETGDLTGEVLSPLVPSAKLHGVVEEWPLFELGDLLGCHGSALELKTPDGRLGEQRDVVGLHRAEISLRVNMPSDRLSHVWSERGGEIIGAGRIVTIVQLDVHVAGASLKFEEVTNVMEQSGGNQGIGGTVLTGEVRTLQTVGELRKFFVISMVAPPVVEIKNSLESHVTGRPRKSSTSETLT